jgi:hypothetical protein
MLEVLLIVVFYFLLLPAAVLAIASVIDTLFDPMNRIHDLLERRQSRRPVDWQNYRDLK